LEDKSVSLVFFDPQYEKAGEVLWINDYPIHYQSESQILFILQEISRVLKPSGFCLLWVNKGILQSERVSLWLMKAPKLKLVDFLVWNKDNWLGLGSYFRSRGEYAFLLQKNPKNSRKFTNRSFPNIWDESKPSDTKKQHPHQKPFFLIRTLIEATTHEGDLVVDPCAGSFIVLEACQSTGREFLGCDLTFEELNEHRQERERERERTTK
jgi:site-specific DNA-methyltransferase (adenine-specific)